MINQNGTLIYKGNMSNGLKKGMGSFKILKEIEDSIEIKGEWGGNFVTGSVKWDSRSQMQKSTGKFRFREQDIIMEHFGVVEYKNKSVHRGFYQDNNLEGVGQQLEMVVSE